MWLTEVPFVDWLEDPDLSAVLRNRLLERMLRGVERQATELYGFQAFKDISAQQLKKTCDVVALFEFMYAHAQFELELPSRASGSANLSVLCSNGLKNAQVKLNDEDVAVSLPEQEDESSWHAWVSAELLGNYAVCRSPFSLRLQVLGAQNAQQSACPLFVTQPPPRNTSVFQGLLKRQIYSSLCIFDKEPATGAPDVNADEEESDEAFQPQDPANAADVPRVLSRLEAEQLSRAGVLQFDRKRLQKAAKYLKEVQVNEDLQITEGFAAFLTRLDTKTRNLTEKLRLRKLQAQGVPVVAHEEPDQSTATTAAEPEPELPRKAVLKFLSQPKSSVETIREYNSALTVFKAQEVVSLIQSIDGHFSTLQNYIAKNTKPNLKNPLALAVLADLDVNEVQWARVKRSLKLLVLNAAIGAPPLYLDHFLIALQEPVQQIMAGREESFMQMKECTWYLGRDPNVERLHRQNWLASRQYCLEFVLTLLPDALVEQISAVFGDYKSK